MKNTQLKKWLIKLKSEQNIFIIIFSVLFLTGTTLLIITFYIYELNDSSALGDTIGGIVGTFINLGAALLIFITFRAQVKANTEISKQVNDDRVTKLFDLFTKSEFYRSIKGKYELLINDCNDAFKSNNLNSELFGHYTDIGYSINNETLKADYEYVNAIYNAAIDAANFKEEPFQKHLLETMYSNLKPYLWSIDKANEEVIDRLPIIKIESSKSQISKTSETFTIKQTKCKVVKLLKLELLKGVKVLKTIDLKNKVIERTKDNIEIKFGKIKSDTYNLKWHIEFNGLIYNYLSDEYQIN